MIGILYLLAIALYAPMMMAREGRHNGQTLGKQMVGVRVIQEDGRPMTLGQGLLREAVGKSLLSLVSCGFYGLLDSLWLLWDRRKQCLHDKVGSTLVVNADADITQTAGLPR